MFFLKQYLLLLSLQLVNYESAPKWPWENAWWSDLHDENISLEQIDNELTNLAKAAEFPRGQLKILLSRVEKTLEELSDDEKKEDKVEIDRILQRIDFLRKELGKMRDEAAAISKSLEPAAKQSEAQTGTPWESWDQEQNDQILRYWLHEMQSDVQALREKWDTISLPLSPEETQKHGTLKIEFDWYKEALTMKLWQYKNGQNIPDGLQSVVQSFLLLDTSLNEMSEREQLIYLEWEGMLYVKELNTLTDIALRDETVVGEKSEKLWEVRNKNLNEKYEKLLLNEEVKKALTSKEWVTPKFSELKMYHIGILIKKWVDISSIFLVTKEWKSFQNWVENGKSYIVSFWENTELEKEMDLAFIIPHADTIKIDGKTMIFNGKELLENGSTFPLRDGSEIDIVSLFESKWSPEESERNEAIEWALKSYNVSSTAQQTILEAIWSENPEAAFKWMRLPWWSLIWGILAFIMQFMTWKAFEYNTQSWNWEEKNTTLSNGDIIDWSIGNYYERWRNNNYLKNFENVEPGTKWLINIIYQVEARWNPNIIFWGSKIHPPKPITEMTVREVRAFQDRMISSGSKSSAVWAPQIIRKTMDAAIESWILSPNEKFDVEAQNRFTLAKMDERGLSKFKNGQISEAKFMENLSMEWASLPKDMNGRSYYDWDGLNKSLVSPQVILRQLKQIKA